MLNLSNMNYNASAESVDSNGEVVATMSFSADNYGNCYMSINYVTVAAMKDASVDTDFAEFKKAAADFITANPIPVTPQPGAAE